jgi:hypothetical protein
MISSINKHVFILDLSNLTLQIFIATCWASMDVASKHSIAWHNSRHVALGRFGLHCGIEETGSAGIICIICDQLLHHPSEHETSSMGKHLVAKPYIAKLHELTGLNVTKLSSSMVDKTALRILKRQGSTEVTIVSLQRKFIFDIQV